MPTTADTRSRLLAAARQAFADLGYGRARVEDIVARAGVGHGTFYAYFRNKRAALAALISENAATLVDLAGQHRADPRAEQHEQQQDDHQQQAGRAAPPPSPSFVRRYMV